MQPDARNPVLAVAWEALNQTENRYFGIPTMRRELARAGMLEPEFRDEWGSFAVCFHRSGDGRAQMPTCANERETKLLDFSSIPRSRREIADFLCLDSMVYAINRYIMPLVEQGLLCMTLPDKKKAPISALCGRICKSQLVPSVCIKTSAGLLVQNACRYLRPPV